MIAYRHSIEIVPTAFRKNPDISILHLYFSLKERPESLKVISPTIWKGTTRLLEVHEVDIDAHLEVVIFNNHITLIQHLQRLESQEIPYLQETLNLLREWAKNIIATQEDVFRTRRIQNPDDRDSVDF